MAKNLNNPNALTEAFFGAAADSQEKDAAEQIQTADTGTIDAGKGGETKRTKRIQVLLTPAEYEAIRQLAYEKRVSQSTLLLEAFKAYCKKEFNIDL